MALASRMQRGVACPVLRALGGNVPQQCGNAPSFDPIWTSWIKNGRVAGCDSAGSRMMATFMFAVNGPASE